MRFISRRQSENSNQGLIEPRRVPGLQAWYDSSAWYPVNSTVYADGACQFTAGDKAYLNVASNATLQTGDIDFEIGGWVYLDSKATTQTIVRKWTASGGLCEYALWYYATDDRFYFTVSNDGTASASVSATNFGSPSTATWYFVRGYHDSVNNVIGISVNNGTANTTAHTTGVKAGTANFNVGANSDAVPSQNLSGRIDSLYFTKTISSAAEATALYNSGSGRIYSDLTSANGLGTFATNLISWWDMREDGDTRYDSKGTNHLSQAFENIIDNTSSLGSELVVNGGFEDVFTEKVTNGGFDSDTANWTAGASTIASVAGGSSGNCLEITNSSATYGYGYQALTLVVGATYTISLYHKNGTGHGAVNVGTSPNGSQMYVGSNLNDADWALKTLTFTATATTGYINLNVNNLTAGSTTLFDTISVTLAGWTAGSNAVLSSETGGQSGRCLKVLNNVTNYGFAYQAITTVANQNYTLSFYQKNSAQGFYCIGTTAGNTDIKAFTALNNADWTQTTLNFKATTTTTYLSFGVNTTGDTDYTLFDTVSLKALTQTNLNGGFESLGTGETLGSELYSNTGFETSGTNGGLKNGVPIVNVARTSNVATIEATGHGLVNGNVATIVSVTTAGFNATDVTVTRVDDDHFTYANTGSDVAETPDATGHVRTDVFANHFELETDGVISKDSTSPHGGTYQLKVTAGVLKSTVCYQSFASTASTRYKLTFWTKGDGTNAGRYSIYDYSNSQNIVATTTTGVTSGTYTQVTKYFTTPAGCTHFGVYWYCPDLATAYAYFDDVSLKQVTASNTFLNWTDSTLGSSTINVETTAPYAGTNALRLDVDSSGSAAYISQSSILTSNHKYKTTFYAKSSSAGNYLKLETGTIENLSWNLTTSYAQYIGYFTETSGANNVVYNRKQVSSVSIYLDDVTLICTEIPSAAGIAAGLAIDGNLCASFNGTSQYLTKTNDAKLQTGDIDFTVFGWVNMASKQSATSEMVIGKYEAAGEKREYALYRSYSPDRFTFAISSDGTSTGATTVSDTTIGSPAVNTWYFIVAWHDSVNNKIGIQTNNGTAISADYSLGATALTGAFGIGCTGATSNLLNGRIDGVGFIKRILTAAEKTAMFNNRKGVKYAGLPSTVSADPTLCYWNLDEFSAGTGAVTRYDSTSNDMDLTDNGTTPSGQGVNYYEGAVSDWYDISGNGKHLTQTTQSDKLLYVTNSMNSKPGIIGDALTKNIQNATDLIGTSNRTVFAVIKPRGWGGGDLGRIIDNSKFAFYVSTTNSQLRAISDGSTAATSASSSIALNTAYVVAVTRTSAGVVNFYINSNTVNGTANQASGTPAAGTPTVVMNNSGKTRGFDGGIYELCIYDSILSTAQIASLMAYFKSKWGIA